MYIHKSRTAEQALYVESLAGREVRALSLQQPWASLLAYAFVFPREMKAIETRGWSTGYRGPVAIHASKSMKPISQACCEEPAIRQALDRIGIGSIKDLPLGKILSVGNLSEVRMIIAPDTKHGSEGLYLMYPPVEPERSFGDYTPGRYGWVFSSMYLLDKPISVSGNQSLWRYTWPS